LGLFGLALLKPLEGHAGSDLALGLVEFKLFFSQGLELGVPGGLRLFSTRGDGKALLAGLVLFDPLGFGCESGFGEVCPLGMEGV
jgi:hypothetical protein